MADTTANDATLLSLMSSGNNAETQKALANELGKSSFYEKHKRPLVRIGEGMGDVRPTSLAMHLLRFSANHGPSEALLAFRELTMLEEQTTSTYVFVDEIDCQDVVDLGDQVRVLPEELAPNAFVSQAIADSRGALSMRRGCFVVARQTQPTFVQAPSDADFLSLLDKVPRSIPGMDRIETALRMITLCGPTAPAPRFRSTIIENAPRLFASETGISWLGPRTSFAPGMPKIVTDEARSLIPGYSRLSVGDKRRVDLAIHRLGEGVRGFRAGDAIVDLCIGFEAVLSDPGNKEELTYRLRLRLALTLEKEIEARRAIKKSLSELYGERSKIVHGAEPDAKDASLRSTGEQLLTRLLRRIIELGQIPEWQSVELSGGLPVAAYRVSPS
jgi:hypothetical protein